MKRQYLHTIALSVVTFVMIIGMLASCGKVPIQDDDCVELMNQAALDMHDMNYSKAKQRLYKVLGHSSNRIHRVSADILMMRITVMTGENKEFFDYRTDAENCLRVLKDEEPYLEGYRLTIWHYVQSSYYRVSAYHFSRNRQQKELNVMLDSLAAHPEWSDADTLDLTARLLPAELINTQSLVQSADVLCDHGEYEEALDSLALALHKINVHHIKYNKVAPDDTLTLTGITTDSLSKEMKWIHDPNIVAIPEWLALVREELSIVYGAMGDKPSSNYNRNIYFDILDATRQDMQIKSREEALMAQARFLNILILMLIFFAIFVGLVTYFVTRRIGRRSKDKSAKLQQCLDICTRMVNGEDVDEDIHALLPHVEGDWTSVDLKNCNVKAYEREMLSLLQVFHSWIAQNTELYETQTEIKENIEGEIYMEQRRMDDNKRRHTDRATAISIVQGITPFLDRAIHQVEKGEAYVDRELLREYVEKINSYNEVLGHWVKVRQGSVTLNIENFTLAPLLETMQKGRRVFESKDITLQVEVVNAVVKADKALTLFMMNTLLDNARKYTPEGGTVQLSVGDEEDYVEVSVTDTGSGLSAEDQDKINNMKVYDSSQIGLENDTDGQIKQNKGFGFGLMNCRGIIEKYRKTGRMFDVCQFGVDSTLGKGSRFFFRLPKGTIRSLVLLILFAFNINAPAQTFDDYLDSVYNCNIVGEYGSAVGYADLAIQCLNQSYTEQTGQTTPLMSLLGESNAYAELKWLEDSVKVNYDLIIQLRNEVSLAALSLADKQLYRYNNESFLRLSKITSADPNMEEYCRRLAQTNADKNLVVAISIVILLLALAIYGLMYYRHTVLPIFNMRVLVEFLKRMFTAPDNKLPALLHQGVSSIQSADAVNVTLADGRTYYSGAGDARTQIPLSVDFEGAKHDVGTMFVAYHGSDPVPEEQIIINFIAKFAAIHIFFASVKVDEQKNLIELLEDQKFAAETEQQRLHVHNMVMDNCLSTIKHETMYYPNRILQLLGQDGDLNVDEIRDVLKYYREVFALLSENANRQLSRSIIKLQPVSLSDVAKYVRKSFERQNKKLMLPVQFEVTGDVDASVRADNTLLQYLLDTLVSLAFEMKTSGKVSLNFVKSKGFIKFALSDDRIERTEDENAKLFYPDSMHYDSNTDLLIGSQYLIAKQIIRDHDERLGHLGCRIYAEGNSVIFTLPNA